MPIFHRPQLLPTILAFAGLFLAGVSLWSQRMFGDVSFEQFVYHTRFGLSGLLQTDTDSIHLFLVYAVLLPLLAALACTVLWLRAQWLLLPAGVALFLLHFSFGTYVASLFGPDLFASYYVSPASVQLLANGRPRSLVIIYVESLESTYQDSTRFGRDLLAPLTQLQQRYARFVHYPQMAGAHWTMAGIIATQCGIPLKISILPSPDDHSLHLRRFLPGALCLGDVLKAQGYQNVFLNGPDLSFADMGVFLKEHGYDRVYGAREWELAGEPHSQLHNWGLRDDQLLRHARSELAALIATGKPFNLTILTVDTHGPKGLMSQECRKRGAQDFKDIVRCTAGQVAEFVQYIEAQGWLDRVAVVVQGDHMAMENPIHDSLEASPTRDIFNLMVTQPVATPSTDTVTHFDLYPTLLELAGLRPQNGRMGLGWCALQSCQAASAPGQRIADFKAGILNRSPIYEQLWLP